MGISPHQLILSKMDILIVGDSLSAKERRARCGENCHQVTSKLSVHLIVEKPSK